MGLAVTVGAVWRMVVLDWWWGRCDYDKYVVQRVEREEMARKAYEAQQREIEKLQGYIDR